MGPKAKKVFDQKAAEKADGVFAELVNRSLQQELNVTAKLDLVDPLHYPMRRLWMDLYQKFGGRTERVHVCLRGRPIRIMPIEIDSKFQQLVNDIFQKRHPELKGQTPSIYMPRAEAGREEWRKLLDEWLDIYEHQGGQTVVIAGLEQGHGVRIPVTTN